MIHDERFNSERRATALHAGIEKKESNLHHCTVLLLDVVVGLSRAGSR
jgi:hypothetical protein